MRDLLWIGYGVLAWWVALRVPGGDALGLAVFALLALAHGGAVYMVGRSGWVRAFVWAAAALLVMASLFVGELGAARPWIAATWPLGVGATLLSVVATEFDRVRRVHDLTSNRLVVRTGVGRLFEESIPLDHVQAVQASQGTLGQLFRFAQLHLTLTERRQVRKKKGEPHEAPKVILKGVPRWEEVKHHIDVALQEQRFPAKQREKRIEERRLRETMGALATWVRREGA